MSESKRVLEGVFGLSQAQVPRVYRGVTGESERWNYTPVSAAVKDELRAMGVKDGDHVRITTEKVVRPTEPETIEDAVRLALDEALEAAGYRESGYQPCERELQAALLDALWNDDCTLREAAEAAVWRCKSVLVREGERVCGGWF